MPPVINLVATIPYEIASDIEYAERRLHSFNEWAFNDHKRAGRGIRDAVDAYGRVWGKLAGRRAFSMEQCRPYNIRIFAGMAYGSEPLPADPVVDQAVAVASAFAEFYATPLVSGKGVAKAKLLSELARRDRLVRMVKNLGDRVRDRVQEDYVRLQPGDWVRGRFRNVIGRVAAVNHARARVTADEYRPSLPGATIECHYTTWDLVRETLEKISPPVPLPLRVPGFEWFRKAVDKQRSLDFRYERKSSGLQEIHNHVKGIEFAVEMLFLSEQPSQVLNSYTKGRHAFPEEHRACFPDWIEGRLRTHYELASQLQALNHKTRPQVDPPPWDQPPSVVQALVELGREMIDLLALHIANQVGRETGAQVRVFGDYCKTLRGNLWGDVDEDLLETDEGYWVRYVGRLATLVGQSGRTLTVEFDLKENLPGLHEVDITIVSP